MRRILVRGKGSVLAVGLLSLGAAMFNAAPAKAALIESWENTLDGWIVPPSYHLEPSYAPVTSFASGPGVGVTDGTYSLAITGTGTTGPDYGQLILGPATAANTLALSTASALDVDIYTPSGAYGFFLQIQAVLNGGGLGFTSLSGYLATTIGSETTPVFPITPAQDATLAASAAGGGTTTILFQVGGGFSAGNETFYVDNLRTVPVPEPTSLGVMGLGATALVRRRRRR